jgi:hypothetical protein
MYALDAEGGLKWSYATGDDITSSPAIGSDGTIYFGSYDGVFYALDGDGTLRWEFTADSPIFSSPAVAADGKIYFGSLDGAFFALDPSGGLRWRFPTDAPVYSSPAIGSDGTIYFGCDDGSLYALDPDGLLLWKFDTNAYISSSPAVGGDGTIYFGSADGYIYAITDEGSLLWRHETGDMANSSPAIGDGVICCGSDDGALYCLQAEATAGSPWPMFHRDPQRGGRAGGTELALQGESKAPFEIAYDDGVGESTRGFAVAGKGWAVRFTPPVSGVILVGVKYYIAGFFGDPSPIEIHVWDGDHQDLITPFSVTPSEEGWFEVDLSQYQLSFTDDFYVGYIQIMPDSHPWIGYDMSGDSDRSYYTSSWTPALPPGSSVMIRAVMQSE